VFYERIRPNAPLSEYVEHLWLVAGGQMPRRERILPSGTVELVVNLHVDRVCIEGSIDAPRARAFSGTVVSGTYASALIVDASQHAAMLGVHFRPAGASVVLGVPCGELTDAHVDLEAIWSAATARELRERLCAAPTHRARLAYLEQCLTQRLAPGRAVHPIVHGALARFTAAGRAPRVEDVARSLGVSHRTLLTLFSAQVGLPPKRFCRIDRFQRVHALAQRAGRIDWSRVALACGFSDQAHLANEFRRLCGVTPTEYEQALRERTHLLSGHVAIS
jgi:AraC-like DNA-binding protein